MCLLLQVPSTIECYVALATLNLDSELLPCKSYS